jgi:hypothetical protein
MSRGKRYGSRRLARLSIFTVMLAGVFSFDVALASTVEITNLELRIDAEPGEQNTILLAGVTPDEGGDVEVEERTAGFGIRGCTSSGTRALCAGGDFEQVIADLKEGQDFLSARETTPIQHPLTVTAGSGNDIVRGGDDPNTLDGGPGDDGLVGGLAPDVLRGDEAALVVRPDAGRDSLQGGGANDVLFARDGLADNKIDCGAGSADRADVDLKDQEPPTTRGERLLNCENITGGAINEGPNVRVSRRAVRLTRRGVARIRLACPSALDSSCSGQLSLNPARGRKLALGARRYRIRPGQKRTVRLRLSRRKRTLVRRLGRRVSVQATALEDGEFGPKTTIVTFTLRAAR